MSLDVVDFIAFATEIYRFKAKLSGAEVDSLFSEYGVYDYLTENYDILHSFGEQRIIWEIKEYIKNQQK